MRSFFNRFSVQLTLGFCLTLAAAMTLAGFSLTRTLKAQWVSDLAADLYAGAEPIVTEMSGLPIENNTQALQRLTKQFSHSGARRITLVRPDGTVVADSDISPVNLSHLENHSDRPEVQSALKGQNSFSLRFSHTIKQDLLYAAVPLRDGDRIKGVVRVAVPLTLVNHRLGHIRWTIFWITLVLMSSALVVTLWFSHVKMNPLRQMARVAEELANGNFSVRMKHISTEELDRLGQTLNYLAERVQTTIRDLSHDRSELSAILNNLVEAVVAVDAGGRILFINPALKELFNIKAGDLELEGRLFLEVIRHNQINETLNAVLKDGQKRASEIKALSPDEQIFDAHAVPLLGGASRIGALLILHNITKIRKLEQIRRDFVANVSHELKTPLAAIKGFAETLRIGGLDDKANRLEFVESIENHADRMSRLVDDLLDLAAIESGKQTLSREPVSLLEVVNEVVDDLKTLASNKKTRVSVEPTGGVPPIRGDKAKLKQVVTNLIDNAIKFNKEGGVVTITLSSNSAGLKMDVRDNGIGIPSQDIPRIFERFYRVDKARSREMGGTGLGLAIVKHIVEVHGGSVQVESSVGKGSTFHVHFPTISSNPS